MIIPNTKRHPNNTKTDQLPISEVITGLPRPVTVYRLPIRLPAKSALTWPVVELVAYKPSQYALVVLLRRRTRIYVQQYCTVNSLRSSKFHQFIISLLQVIRDIRMYIPPHSSPGGVPFPWVRTGTAAAVYSYIRTAVLYCFFLFLPSRRLLS